MVVGRAVPLLLDRELAVRAQLTKRHGAVRLGGEVHPDGDGHHPETDRASPHGTGHGYGLLC